MSDQTSRKREGCSLCHFTKLTTVLRLGATAPANQYVREVDAKQQKYPLELVMCDECSHIQISVLVNPDVLFGDYAYATSTSPATLEHLENEVNFVKKWHERQNKTAIDAKTFVLEIGSNDGAMLKMWQRKGAGLVLGIDPTSDKLKAYEDVATLSKFFTHHLATKIKEEYGSPDIIVANNVLAHVPDILDVVLGVKHLLADGGTFVFEVSYLMDMAEAPLFDTIYHEHMSYHTVKPLALLLDRVGMPIREVMRLPNQLGRGSLRVVASKGQGRSIDSPNVRELMLKEVNLGLWGADFWRGFAVKVIEQGDKVRTWISALRSMNEPVFGYGAAAKLTTLMHAWRLDKEHIDFVVDDSPWKQGLYTPDTHIPILAPSMLMEHQTSTVVLFAWNFGAQIARSLREMGWKGKVVLPLPELVEADLSK